MKAETSFNMEEFGEFLNLAPAENISSEAIDIGHENIPDWDDYPNLWSTNEMENPPNDPISLISFDGASLLKEEYVDPFAALNSKKGKPKEAFLEKLQHRRMKLEQMAKSLSSSSVDNSISISPVRCRTSTQAHWNVDRRPVQAYPLFSIEINHKQSSFPSLENLVEQSHNLYIKNEASDEIKRQGKSLFHFMSIYSPELIQII
jgi:hypothetical protein